MAFSIWHWWDTLWPQFLERNEDAIAGEVGRDEIRDWLKANAYRKTLPPNIRQSELVEVAFKWGLRVLDRVGTHEFSDVDFGWPGYDFTMFTMQAEPTWLDGGSLDLLSESLTELLQEHLQAQDEPIELVMVDPDDGKTS